MDETTLFSPSVYSEKRLPVDLKLPILITVITLVIIIVAATIVLYMEQTKA